jgi:preprotein translocase subunit SecA
VWKLLTQIFGSRNQRLVKELSRTVAAINGFEAATAKLTDGEFPEKTRELNWCLKRSPWCGRRHAAA